MDFVTVSRNTIGHHNDFRAIPAKYSVSGRMLKPDRDVATYLDTYYYFVNPAQIESLFGTYPFPSRLWGGWGFDEGSAMNDRHIEQMRGLGIGIALTVTNHFFDEAAYRESWPMFEKLQAPCNSLIITNDALARRVRADFPAYKLKASITKHVQTVERLKRMYELYDYVLFPMDKNDDDALLETIPEKERIILFANAGCAYLCPARTCYLGNSQGICGKEVTSRCSKTRFPREHLPYTIFDVKKLWGMGFSFFKLIPPKTTQLTVRLRRVGWEDTPDER